MASAKKIKQGEQSKPSVVGCSLSRPDTLAEVTFSLLVCKTKFIGLQNSASLLYDRETVSGSETTRLGD